MKKIFFVILVMFFFIDIRISRAEKAQYLFETYKSTIYQIRVIELASGNKSTIGSGFQISKEGHIATNFHVISAVIMNPEKYRVEFLQHDGKSGHLKILDIDIIHDLAIVMKEDNDSASLLDLREGPLSNGIKIFSLGNPYDLGLTIVEGKYNGLLDRSLYEKILFSGSLNPGMSGGPAIDEFGKIVGINVSTIGNQISFLVPAQYLKNLLENVKNSGSKTPAEFKSKIEKQLIQNQDNYISSFISNEWKVLTLGDAKIPGEMANFFKCWGETDRADQVLYVHTYISCSTSDEIFLTKNLKTGKILYNYHWYKEDGLGTLRFYNMYEDVYKKMRGVNFAKKEDVTEYLCNSNFIDASGKEWKSVFCARQYKDYPAIYDVFFNMALVSENDRGLIIVLSFSGVTEEMGISLVRKFVENIKWQN